MPVRMSCEIAGRMTVVKRCTGLAPRLRATLIHAGSMRRTPAAVANRIGHTAATAIRNTIAPSQLENESTAIGIQASGLIMRRNWNGTLVISRAIRERPTRMPSGTPMTIAHMSPRPTRHRLGLVIRHASPEPTICTNRLNVGHGAKSANAAVRGSLATTRPHSHHTSRSPAMPMSANPTERAHAGNCGTASASASLRANPLWV